MRQLLTLAAMFAATAAHALDPLILPADPGPEATVVVSKLTHDLLLNIPPDYPLDDEPLFGYSGDLDGGFAVIGAPEVLGSGSAFVFNADTGEHISTLSTGHFLYGRSIFSSFGGTVDVEGVLGVITAPQAGFSDCGPGLAMVFNVVTGERLQTIWGQEGQYTFIGDARIDGAFVELAITDYFGGNVRPLRVALTIPEPTTLALAAMLGVCGLLHRRPQN
ncbi:hypothetical protein [Botrimarina mediterranea]|uniref:PEP-CTERM protein-sorting domain-containing protein n=1 Tax=Botrimarina mediterranea TaxID=2528022 RepID=A0A518K945_9BACT|nr:hypothetical protein [Botrimarina mediterranea]QDV74314.1 hypothetical protein Spa11_25160 [Botrimarina mediterranea]